MEHNTCTVQKQGTDIKVKNDLIKRFDNKYSIDVLDRKIHSLRTSMQREVKREAEETTDEPPSEKPNRKSWPYFEAMSFMKEEILRGELSLNKLC